MWITDFVSKKIQPQIKHHKKWHLYGAPSMNDMNISIFKYLDWLITIYE